MTWTADDPGAGDVAGIASMAAARRTAASELTHSSLTPLRSAIASVHTSEWAGKAAKAFDTTAQSLLPDLQLIIGGLENDARALETYAAAVDAIKHDSVPLRSHRDSLQADITAGIDKLAAPDYAGTLTASESQKLTLSVGDKQVELRQVESQWDELSTRRRQADAAFDAALDSAASRGPLAAATAPGKKYTDAQLLALIKGMSASDITILMKQRPDLAKQLTDDLNSWSAAKVNAWWGALAPAVAIGLIAGIPIAIGNLNGVPYGARDAANRTELPLDIAASKARLAKLEAESAEFVKSGMLAETDGLDPFASQIEAEQKNLDGLESINASLSGVGNAPRELLSLSQDHPPLAAVSIGDIDTAKDVTYMVPGMDSDTSGMGDWSNAAQNLYNEQGFVGGDSQRAVVAWMGYVSPKLDKSEIPGASVFASFDADVGAKKLDHDLLGFDSIRKPDVTLNVVGHSYGTTTASLALANQNLHVNSFVSLASAGIDTRIPDAGAIQAQHVYVGEGKDAPQGSGDYLAWTGRLLSGRTDPASPGFGATVFGVDGTSGSHAEAGVTTHDANPGSGTGYFSKHSESLRNTALATTGGGAKVIPAHDQGLPTDVINFLEKGTNNEAKAGTAIGEFIRSVNGGTF